jgi:hypothetical protein
MTVWLTSVKEIFMVVAAWTFQQGFFLFFNSYVHTMFGSFLPPSPPPPPCPRYQAETILPLSLILLKREYKQ